MILNLDDFERFSKRDFRKILAIEVIFEGKAESLRALNEADFGKPLTVILPRDENGIGFEQEALKRFCKVLAQCQNLFELDIPLRFLPPVTAAKLAQIKLILDSNIKIHHIIPHLHEIYSYFPFIKERYLLHLRQSTYENARKYIEIKMSEGLNFAESFKLDPEVFVDKYIPEVFFVTKEVRSKVIEFEKSKAIFDVFFVKVITDGMQYLSLVNEPCPIVSRFETRSKPKKVRFAVKDDEKKGVGDKNTLEDCRKKLEFN